MKNLLFVLALMMGCSTALIAQAESEGTESEATEAGPQMEFETEVLDYGTIAKGSDPYRTFKFTNVGNEPVVIKNAKGSCGCTVPDAPKEPILPGESAEIKVRYDTNRVGPFTKTVTLTTNEAKSRRVLTIKGVVENKPVEDGLPEKASNPLSGGNGGF